MLHLQYTTRFSRSTHYFSINANKTLFELKMVLEVWESSKVYDLKVARYGNKYYLRTLSCDYDLKTLAELCIVSGSRFIAIYHDLSYYESNLSKCIRIPEVEILTKGKFCYRIARDQNITSAPRTSTKHNTSVFRNRINNSGVKHELFYEGFQNEPSYKELIILTECEPHSVKIGNDISFL